MKRFDHDGLFKKFIAVFVMPFLELFDPELASWIQPDSIKFMDKEFFQHPTSAERVEVDVLAFFSFANQFMNALLPFTKLPANGMLHIEYQMQPSKEPLDQRMYRYHTRIADVYPDPIYSIIVLTYQSDTATPDHYWRGFPNGMGLSFRYRVIDLKRLDWNAFRGNPNPAAIALIPLMHIPAKERVRAKLECLTMLASLNLDDKARQLVALFISNYIKLTAQQQHEFQQELEQLEAQERKQIMTFMTEWERKGLRKGVRIGRRKGRQEQRESNRQELCLVATQLLTRHLGELPLEVQQRLAALATEQLQAVTLAFLDLTSVADLVTWLDSHTPAAS